MEYAYPKNDFGVDDQNQSNIASSVGHNSETTTNHDSSKEFISNLCRQVTIKISNKTNKTNHYDASQQYRTNFFKSLHTSSTNEQLKDVPASDSPCVSNITAAPNKIIWISIFLIMIILQATRTLQFDK
eukprot:14407784-Ditylum_brightwellii.AAC.1